MAETRRAFERRAWAAVIATLVLSVLVIAILALLPASIATMLDDVFGRARDLLRS